MVANTALFCHWLVRALPELKTSARRFVGSAEADDLVQETCRRALAAKSQFDAGSNLSAWLFCIMRNIHRDRLRMAGREVLLVAGWDNVATPPVDPKPTWMITSDDAVAGAIDSLAAPYRETFALHAVEGLRYAEIAHRLGIPTSTVGTRLRRARVQIRTMLQTPTVPTGDHDPRSRKGRSRPAPSPSSVPQGSDPRARTEEGDRAMARARRSPFIDHGALLMSSGHVRSADMPVRQPICRR